MPNNKVADVTISVTSTGVISAIFGTGLALTPGLYWIGSKVISIPNCSAYRMLPTNYPSLGLFGITGITAVSSFLMSNLNSGFPASAVKTDLTLGFVANNYLFSKWSS